MASFYPMYGFGEHLEEYRIAGKNYRTHISLWDTLEDELQANADMTFDLIGNLGTIDYKQQIAKKLLHRMNGNIFLVNF